MNLVQVETHFLKHTFLLLAPRTLPQRALGVLGHQKRFLREHKAGLEKWTSGVYGYNLSPGESTSTRVDGPTIEAELDVMRGTNQDRPRERAGVGKAQLREIRVSVKCKGADKHRTERTIPARVDRAWCPQQRRLANGKKRASCKIEAEKLAKRSKPAVVKLEETVIVDTNSPEGGVEEIAEDEVIDDATAAGVPDTPGQIWNWLDDSNYFSPVSRRQPLPEDLTLEAEDRLGRSSLVSLRPSASAPAPKTASESGTRQCASGFCHAVYVSYRPRVNSKIYAMSAVTGHDTFMSSQ